ncbi:MAG TPA: DUF2249 domain-containing protein [Gemmatimonadaceae bacterium]|nr:DUF2249 domain-containing protein [Gemmatimonadaceae bacterium]
MSSRPATPSPELLSSVASAVSGAGSTDPSTVAALTRVLARTLRRLGQAGAPWDASRLAAEGWSLLRECHPRDAERLNGAMHYLARLEQQLEAQGHNDPQGVVVASEDRVIDVRSETPKVRHEIIFDEWAALEPGTAYVLVNDHDPKPLWYQFDAEHKGEFTWDALEEGPEVWRVRIGRVAR